MGVFKLSKPSPVQLDPAQPLSESIDTLIANELCFAPVIKDKILVGILNLAIALKWTRTNEYLKTPAKVNDVMSKISNFSESSVKLPPLTLKRLKEDNIIVQNPRMMKLFDLAMRAARTDVAVLLLGETGVGKEVFARVIHNTSNRADTGSLIQINCGAIPENLLESELFGYEPGAFTGANRKGKSGIFEAATHGTLLLDEIGDLPLNLQVKLLRVLQDQEIYHIGSTSPIKINTRIITATNRNLWECVQDGSFREDLYYRLNVFPIEVPPLRERKEDILPLSIHFIQLYNEKYRVAKRLDPQAIPLLKAYSWPGNVRELQNILERLMVITDDEIIEASHVQFQLASNEPKFNSPITVNRLVPIQEARDILEKELINMALDYYPSYRKAAEALEIDHSNIVRKVAKYCIKKVN